MFARLRIEEQSAQALKSRHMSRLGICRGSAWEPWPAPNRLIGRRAFYSAEPAWQLSRTGHVDDLAFGDRVDREQVVEGSGWHLAI